MNFLLDIYENLNIEKFKFYIIGEGDGKEDIQKYIENNRSDNLIFLHSMERDELMKIMYRSKIGISPIPPNEIYKISSPTKIFEYLAAGMAVIGNSEIYDQNSVIMNSKSGYAVSYDSIQFAKAIEKILLDVEIFSEFSDNSITYIKENRNYHVISENLYRFYKKSITK